MSEDEVKLYVMNLQVNVNAGLSSIWGTKTTYFYLLLFWLLPPKDGKTTAKRRQNRPAKTMRACFILNLEKTPLNLASLASCKMPATVGFARPLMPLRQVTGKLPSKYLPEPRSGHPCFTRSRSSAFFALFHLSMVPTR